MPVQITIRNVPEDVSDELKRRAALKGQTLQGFLLSEFEKMTSKPTIGEWLENVREWQDKSGVNVPVSAILEARDADRK